MNETEIRIPRSEVDRSTAGSRLLIGLLQGFALFGIYQAGVTGVWHAGNSAVFAALLMALAIVPVLWISGLGHLPAKTLWRWLLPAAVVLALLGCYDIWRSAGAPYWDTPKHADAARYPSPQLWLHAVAGFLIAHAMVCAAATDGRRIAAYRTYFECASKLLVQAAFAAAFTGIVWLVLLLGAALFNMIKLAFLKDMLDEPWFAIPVSTFAFAYALHLTDVRPAIVHGVRGLVLVLLSWILPIAVLLIGGFLLALPFTGMEPLWATKAATALLLAASAVLALLINAAFQDGAVAEALAMPIRIAVRIAAVLILPLALIAAYALGLRVGQYGWTVDRLVAAFCLVVALSCGGGYLWALLRSPHWLSRIAQVNIFTAFILLVLLLAIFSPVLDPARISVNSQLARLESGKVQAQDFDFEYLRFNGQRFGNAALREMATRKTGKDAALIALKADAALRRETPWGGSAQAIGPEQLAANVTAHPAGTRLPDGFLAQDWQSIIGTDVWLYPGCLHDASKTCDAFVLDADADGRMELALLHDAKLTLFGQDGGSWVRIGYFTLGTNCKQARDSLRAGRFALSQSRWLDLTLDGRRYRLTEAGGDCPKAVD